MSDVVVELFGDLTGADDILEVDDLVIEEVVVPEWKRKVYVRSLTGVERDAYEQSLLKGKGRNRDIDLKSARAKLVILSVINPETRQRIFHERDLPKLTQKNAAALDRISSVAQKLSGLRDEDLEEMTKNSEGTLGVDSI